MDYKRGIWAAVVTAVFLAPCAAFAQSIVDAVRVGLDNSPTLQAERARHNALIEQQVQARNLRRPNIQLEATSSIRESAILDSGSYDLGRTEPGSIAISATQPLMLGGRYQAAQREADLRVGRSIALIRGQELEAVRQIIEAYANVRRDFRVAEIRAEGVSWLTQQLTGANSRQNEGLVGLTEVSQVETRLAGARAAASSAQARLQGSWATLERRLGTRPSGLTEDAIDPVGLPDTLQEAIDVAILSSNELKASRYDEDIARAIARKAEAENAPWVNLQAGVSGRSDTRYNGDRDYNAQIGVRLVVPLWSAGQPQSRTRAALAESTAARLESVANERLLTEQVTTAWAALVAARSSKTIAEELVRAAESARRGAELEFDIGLRSIIEVLNQEQELQNAKVNLENAKADLMSAQATMFNLLGLDPTGVVNETTQYDPTRVTAPFSAPLPGKLAKWEKPLVAAFEVLDNAQIDTEPAVKVVKRAIFGPEQ